MNNRSCCNPGKPRQATKGFGLIELAGFALLACATCVAGDAPQWMHAQANVSLPSYDDKTDAVLLYSETEVSVISVDKIKTTVREAEPWRSSRVVQSAAKNQELSRVVYSGTGKRF